MLIRITTPDTNIFDIADNDFNTAVCVTTNGKVKTNGYAVMGRGIALEADRRFHLAERLGKLLSRYGNVPFDMGSMTHHGGEAHRYHIITFPTKHHWKDPSDIKLIERSAKKLVEICDKNNITKCYLPPVGCGLGGLDFNRDVAPVLSKILDNRFIIIIR